MRRATRHPTTALPRRGLAPLELVLALPILLMIMALMIGFGARWCWKIRGYSMARHAAFSSRYPRSLGINPRPDYWPPGANAGAGPADDAPQLDFAEAYHPVVRQPGLPGAAIREERLDPAAGIIEGTASVLVDSRVLREFGGYRATAHVWLLNDQWQYAEMGLPNTVERRVPVLYTLATAPAEFAAAYRWAVLALLRAPFRPQLAPLDRDDEFSRRGSPPDFHPALRGFSTLDPELINERVQDLIDRIQGDIEIDDDGDVHRTSSVPERMARAFIDFYEEEIVRLGQPYYPNPPPPAVAAQIAQLEMKIAQLQQFQTMLQNTYVP